jgi:hypothetical protein
MSNLREAAQQALEAMACMRDMVAHPDNLQFIDNAITALRTALAEPEQEPVAWEQFYPDIGKPQTTHWEGCEAVHPECREPEQEPLQESRPIYLAEVTMPEPLIGGYILDDDLWCNGAAWCLECRHEWVAVWPLGAESLECPACGSTDTDREQAGPHKRKGEQT